MPKKDVVVDTIQIALFPNNFGIENPTSFGTKLLMNKVIKEDDLVINSYLDEKAPANIVRLEAKIANKREIEVIVSQSKVDFFWRNFKSEVDYQIDVSEILKVVKEFCEVILKDHTFTRVGFITTLYKEIDDPQELIKLNILNKNKFSSDLLDGQIKLTFDYQSSDLDKTVNYNKHILITDGKKKNDLTKKVVGIQYDLNTRQDQKLEWSFKEVEVFIKNAQKTSDKDVIFKEFFG